MFAALGASVIDADQLAREVVEPGTPGLARIAARFGQTVLDPEGRLDRKKLAQVVFNDEAERNALNAIIHPAVRERSLQKIAELAERGAEVIVYDVPLLFETGLDRQFPEVIVVAVDPQTQRRRVAARDQMTPEEIEARIAAQMPLAEKIKRATWVIDNSGSLEDTKNRVAELYRELASQGEKR